MGLLQEYFQAHQHCKPKLFTIMITGLPELLLLLLNNINGCYSEYQGLLCNSQVRSQLAASESSVSSLKAELSKAEAQAKEFSSLQQALEQAEQGKRTLAQDWQKEQASLERQLQAAGKNRDQLAEQVLSCAGSRLLKKERKEKLHH